MNFALNFANRDDTKPALFYVGFEGHETGEEYSHPVFWLKDNGVSVNRLVWTYINQSIQFDGISVMKVKRGDPTFNAPDHLTMYYVYHLDEPPAPFDQREAFIQYVKEEMRSGDFVGITMNQTDHSIEEHLVTNNKLSAHEVNGKTVKVFHLRSGRRLYNLLEKFENKMECKLKSAGKDCGTIFNIYKKTEVEG